MFRGNGMIQENFEQNQKLDKIFKDTQLQEIIKAIILGKYAWACVLFLHFSGCDPLDYMPSETYDKLVQENNLFPENNPAIIDKSKLNFTGLKLSWFNFSGGENSKN
jgi:hypothetical protein